MIGFLWNLSLNYLTECESHKPKEVSGAHILCFLILFQNFICLGGTKPSSETTPTEPAPAPDTTATTEAEKRLSTSNVAKRTSLRSFTELVQPSPTNTKGRYKTIPKWDYSMTSFVTIFCLGMKLNCWFCCYWLMLLVFILSLFVWDFIFLQWIFYISWRQTSMCPSFISMQSVDAQLSWDFGNENYSSVQSKICKFPKCSSCVKCNWCI